MLRRALGTLFLSACVALAVVGCGAGSSAPVPSNRESTGASTPAAPAPAQSTDHSVQEYGSKASGTQADAPVAAMRSFFRAMSGGDYAGVCAGLAAANVKQLSRFSDRGGCPAALKLLNFKGAKPTARAAAEAAIDSVRIKGDTAFVLFTPKGGRPSFFVMKRESGSWKAISPTPGTPLSP